MVRRTRAHGPQIPWMVSCIRSEGRQGPSQITLELDFLSGANAPLIRPSLSRLDDFMT